jgi:hypothetical protein
MVVLVVVASERSIGSEDSVILGLLTQLPAELRW